MSSSTKQLLTILAGCALVGLLLALCVSPILGIMVWSGSSASLLYAEYASRKERLALAARLDAIAAHGLEVGRKMAGLSSGSSLLFSKVLADYMASQRVMQDTARSLRK